MRVTAARALRAASAVLVVLGLGAGSAIAASQEADPKPAEQKKPDQPVESPITIDAIEEEMAKLLNEISGNKSR